MKSTLFTPLDWLILAAYVVAVCVLGSTFYRRKTTGSEFFLGGRAMRALPVAISLVAADMSAISYMGAPAWTFQYNMQLFFSSCTYLLIAPVVMFVFLPFYSRLRLYTGYEYLERHTRIAQFLYDQYQPHCPHQSSHQWPYQPLGLSAWEYTLLLRYL